MNGQANVSEKSKQGIIKLFLLETKHEIGSDSVRKTREFNIWYGACAFQSSKAAADWEVACAKIPQGQRRGPLLSLFCEHLVRGCFLRDNDRKLKSTGCGQRKKSRT
jgi:hypothetical protein